ncbi:pirin family protein [Congregibacter brevis]|uniref:Pirin family protein n=1 Tax=Congregibacter brevis TaxID=3081201 RepID=A0ABZ0IDJ3_9GAMM|nr:pirin family protein [Congregibacter sp. IMCC45268]
MNREIQQVFNAQPSMDGAGVAIHRVAGFEKAAMDPILMIDELRSEHREDFAAGFPPHPHRGMQTLTYMKHGGIIHEDSLGNRGEIQSGGAQYMSAGKGIIHSEMPTQDTAGLHGFQLWFNLPAAQKMQAPRYRDLPVTELAHLAGRGFNLTAVSGDWHVAGTSNLEGPLSELAPQAALADLNLEPTVELTFAVQLEESVMVYIYNGDVDLGGNSYGERQMLLFGAGDTVSLKGGIHGAGVLLLRGRPIGERVVHYGPFVMNTEAEIEEAIRDYQSGRFAA